MQLATKTFERVMHMMSANRQWQCKVLSLILGVLAVAFLHFNLRADTWPVVLTGQLAPGTANGRFTALSQGRVNASGDIVFSANLDVGGVQGAGIFRISEGVLSPIALEGQTLPDAPDKSFGAVLGDPHINNAGEVAFVANFASGTSVPLGLFLFSKGTLRKLLDTTTAVPEAPGQTFDTFRNIRINDAGEIAFAADVKTGTVGRAIYLLSQGNVQPVVTTNNVNVAFSLNNHGDIAFVTQQNGIALFSNGSVQSVAVAGQAVPDSTLTVFTQGPIWMNEDRDIVFVNYSPIGSGRGGSLPTANGIVRWRGGVLEKIVKGGDPVPGIAGAAFDSSEFLQPQINQSGIVFTGRTTTQGQTIELITRYQNGELSTIARGDQLVEGLGLLNFIGEPSFDTQQGPLVTFVANLGPMAGIFAATSPRFTLLFPQIADGTGSGGSWRTTFVLANRSSSPASATLSFFDDSGRPMSLGIAGQQQTQQSVTVPGLGVAQIQTDGASVLKTGWATVQTDQSLSGIALFAFSDGAGKFVNEVGAPATVPLRSMSIFVDAGAGTSTGVALANPNSVSADLTFILRDSNSNEMARTSLNIPTNGHLARYVGELLPLNISGDFHGKLDIVSTQPLVSLTLRQRETVFTSLPVIP